jgi:thioredoxin 1
MRDSTRKAKLRKKQQKWEKTNLMKRLHKATLGSLLLLSTAFLLMNVAIVCAEPGTSPEVPVKDMVTMVDLGAKSCIPCKMMAPILEKLEKDYKGKAAILFIDVWKDPDQAKRFGIQTIPTQIFYDKQGKEVLRHSGFMSEEAIVAQLKKMGVN